MSIKRAEGVVASEMPDHTLYVYFRLDSTIILMVIDLKKYLFYSKSIFLETDWKV